MIRKLSTHAIFCMLLLGCSAVKEDSKKSANTHSVSKLCSGTTQVRLSAVTNYLAYSLKDKNDPQIESLFKEYSIGSDGNLNEDLSLEDCRVAADGSLSLTANNGKGASKSFVFATKGSSFIALGMELSRPTPEDTSTCQQDKLTFYTLALSDEFAAYGESPADKDYVLDFAQTADAEVFSDADCKTLVKSINFLKSSKSMPLWFRVAADKKATLAFTIGGSGYGDNKTVWGPVSPPKATEPNTDADAIRAKAPSAPEIDAAAPAAPTAPVIDAAAPSSPK